MPGFLERDEGEREPPLRAYPVGRRQRRAAVPRLRVDDDGRRVLYGANANGRREGMKGTEVPMTLSFRASYL